jgi:ATP-dependent Lon protease
MQIVRDDEIIEVEETLPLLPLRDMVVFPYMMIPFLVGRPTSISAIEEAMEGGRIIFLTSQKKPDISEPSRKDLYRVGTVARILQLFRLPNGTVKVLVEGLERVRISRFLPGRDYFVVRIRPMRDQVKHDKRFEAAFRQVKLLFEEYVKLNKRIPDEVIYTLGMIEDVVKQIYLISSHLITKIHKKQKILESESALYQIELITTILSVELEILRLEKKIESKIETSVRKNQKEFYLHEQLKAIQKELGSLDDDLMEFDRLLQKIKKARMPKDVEKKASHELKRLKKMNLMSPEATVVRTYLDWLISLPWAVETRDNHDMKKASKILEEDHYGLSGPKERVLEYLAVLKLVRKIRGPILCFVGPPGVGKTSFARSIARALGRKFVRMSLGGVRDEAEIRGHRRTYIGALPGRIIQSISKAGSLNPLFLLDEVDKMSMDFRGDPSAALLEVLDPELNNTFVDHYLEVEFDLSKVLFITTANMLDTIPPALQDRMEVIRFPGYLHFEKKSIAREFLVPKQLERHGLNHEMVKFCDSSLYSLIDKYTREVGVRNLEREIAAICRKVARRVARDGKPSRPVRIHRGNLKHLIGKLKYFKQRMPERDRTGVACGLAWTPAGGDLLLVEVSLLKGKGELILTGKLGDVMKESAQAALSYARSRSEFFSFEDDFYKKWDIHVHVPEGAVPKDGPSAGITIASAIISALTGIPVRRDVAMTGEITIRGDILPVGGIPEKIVAAHAIGYRSIILPSRNMKDVEEIPGKVLRGLKFTYVDSMDEVLRVSLTEPAYFQAPLQQSEGNTRDGVDGHGGYGSYRTPPL